MLPEFSQSIIQATHFPRSCISKHPRLASHPHNKINQPCYCTHHIFRQSPSCKANQQQNQSITETTSLFCGSKTLQCCPHKFERRFRLLALEAMDGSWPQFLPFVRLAFWHTCICLVPGCVAGLLFRSRLVCDCLQSCRCFAGWIFFSWLVLRWLVTI